jgi:hypothetical protein
LKLAKVFCVSALALGAACGAAMASDADAEKLLQRGRISGSLNATCLVVDSDVVASNF